MYNANKGILVADLVAKRDNLNTRMNEVRESIAKCKMGDDARLNSLLNERNILSVKLQNIATKLTNLENHLPSNGYPEEVVEIESLDLDPVKKALLRGIM